MKKLVVALAALLVSFAAQAQEARRPVGVGVTVTPTIDVLVPINVAPNLRIEPLIGISTSNAPGNGTDSRDIRIGAGVFFVQRIAAPFDIYMGGRIRLDFVHAETPVGGGTIVTASGTDVDVAAAIGGEYYLASHFSLGAEAQLGFFSDSDASGDDSGVFTQGLALVRFYF